MSFCNFSDTISDFFSGSEKIISNIIVNTIGDPFKFDIYENGSSYFIKVDIPGLKAEEIRVYTVNYDLTIEFEKGEKIESDDYEYIFRGRNYGYFKKFMKLPINSKRDEVAAEYRDGVLKVTIPKMEESLYRLVKIENDKVGHIANVSKSSVSDASEIPVSDASEIPKVDSIDKKKSSNRNIGSYY
jgi:HSP20 family protein